MKSQDKTATLRNWSTSTLQYQLELAVYRKENVTHCPRHDSAFIKLISCELYRRNAMLRPVTARERKIMETRVIKI